jgi:hypothetical protein
VSWRVSADPEFSRKASEIVGLYLNPPENAIVLSVDEKPSIQALERARYIRLPNGRAVSGFAHEYKRHGTPTLFAALETATGLVNAGHYKRRRRRVPGFHERRHRSLRKGKGDSCHPRQSQYPQAQERPLAQEPSQRQSEIKQQPLRKNIADLCN